MHVERHTIRILSRIGFAAVAAAAMAAGGCGGGHHTDKTTVETHQSTDTPSGSTTTERHTETHIEHR